MKLITCKNGTKLIYHRDFSGDIEVEDIDGTVVLVPGIDILKIVAEYINLVKIAKLEQEEFWESLFG